MADFLFLSVNGDMMSGKCRTVCLLLYAQLESLSIDDKNYNSDIKRQSENRKKVSQTAGGRWLFIYHRVSSFNLC